MLTENFRVTNKEHYGMLWYFLEWSIHEACNDSKTYPGANLRVQYLIMLTQKGHN